jgi:hypothetical protein
MAEEKMRVGIEQLKTKQQVKSRCQGCSQYGQEYGKKNVDVVILRNKKGGKFGMFHKQCFLNTFYPLVNKLATEDWQSK